MKAHQLHGPHKGRTILTEGDAPVCVEMVARASETAPGRIKVMFVIPTEVGALPCPVAQPTIAARGQKPHGFTPEFRLEMN